MATRKQRRRREKEKRHDYEVVYLDDEGNEVEPEDSDARPAGKKQTGKDERSGRGSGRGARRGRQPQPPSWRRVLRRGALFGPIFLATVLLLGGKKMSFPAAVLQTVILIAVFVPFSYVMDRMLWRSYQRRLGRGAAGKR